jgi:lycopene beta-cyclase
MGIERFQYLMVLGACLAITLPLEFVFSARVYRRPRRVLRALAVPVALFVAWDVIAIARGSWTYNPRYVTGWNLPLDLPVEELLFFLVIPLCTLLTYESVRRVLGETRG